MTESYDHVIASRRHLVEASQAERLWSINQDIWIDYPVAVAILGKIRYLLSLPPKKQAPCVLIQGASGVGKSALYERILGLFGPASKGERCLVGMTVNSQHVDNHRKFRDDVVRTVTFDMFSSSAIRPSLLRSALETRGVGGLVLDEGNDLLLALNRTQDINMKQMKELSCEPFCMMIVCIGTESLADAVSSDPQFVRRFHKMELPIWTDENQVRSFVETYISTFPLRQPSKITRQIVQYLIKENRSVLDSIVKQLQTAASWAVLNDVDYLDLELLKQGKILPSF